MCVVPHGETSFGYEIRRGRRALACSQEAFGTYDAAFAAAQQFIDAADRRMGLRQSEGEGRDGAKRALGHEFTES